MLKRTFLLLNIILGLQECVYEEISKRDGSNQVDN
jgi:hypothetical protein